MAVGSAVAGVGDERNRAVEASSARARVHGIFRASYHRRHVGKCEGTFRGLRARDACTAHFDG